MPSKKQKQRRKKKIVETNINGKPCQKRKGKKCILYNGQWKYYTDAKDLAKQLTISVTAAKNLILENGDRIAIGPVGNTLKFNIKKENFRGLLRDFYGVKKINNKQVIADISEIPSRDTTIMKEAKPVETARWHIYVTIYVTFKSPYEVTKDMIMTKKKIDHSKIQEHSDTGALRDLPYDFTYNGKNSGIEDKIKEEVLKYMTRLRFAKLVYYEFRTVSIFKEREVQLKNGTVRDFEDVFELSEWCNIEYNNSRKDSCAVKLIKDRYPELYWDIKILEKEENGKKGVKIGAFINFCKDNDIGYNIYSEQNRILFSFTGENGVITCMIFNNHIYPINGGKPRRTSKKQIKKIIVSESESLKILKEMFDKKILPHGMKLKHGNKKSNIYVSPINYKDKKIICNDEYEQCLHILKKMGYAVYIYDDIKITSIPNLLEKILKTPNITSFIPEKDIFKTAPLLWKTSNKIKPTRVITKNGKEITQWLRTIDKNKCYTYSLYKLPYLIVFDYRKHKININPKNINDSYLYVVRPKKWSIYMPKTKIYAGYHLLKCIEKGIEFELLEEMETERKPNYFRQIIKLMFKNMSNDEFKFSMNVFIGNMERSASATDVFNYTSICNNESSKTNSGFCHKVGEMNLFYNSTKKYLHVRDRLPISIQIKDMSRMIVCDKIIEMNLADDDIVQINTDSISYYGELPKGLTPTEIGAWKTIEFKELGDIDDFYDEEINVTNIINTNDKKRILHSQYAGSGKTYYIINYLVPRLLKEGKSFIILTPTHETLDEYRRNNINCQIIQKYSLSNTIPEEDYIIIDEIGFIDSACHDVLYNINAAGKEFECFGDFNQLPPVAEKIELPSNQPHYLRYMFNEVCTNFVNYRNNFTKEYYDKLINNELDLVSEVHKWSCKKMTNAEYILCFNCNKNPKKPEKIPTKTIYNNLMLKKLGFKEWNEVGAKIICKTNKLIYKKIYHNKHFEILEIDDAEDITIYTLVDSANKRFVINEIELFKNFESGYALNIHQAQGMTLKSYYWASDDDKFINSNIAYTIISRLKQKLNFDINREIDKAEKAGIII